MKSPVTTLCYIEQDDKYLMLHRIKRKMISTKINGWGSEAMRRKEKARKIVF